MIFLSGEVWRTEPVTCSSEDPTRTENFTYDAWSRLATARTGNGTTWGLSWQYDRFGNRLQQNVTAGQAPGPSVSVDPATNRINSTGYAYDAAGNMTNDAANTYSYNAENRITSVNSGLATYAYLGALRVKRNFGGTTIYVYSGTVPIAEYAAGAQVTQPLKEYIYSGSQLLATVDASTGLSYQYPDHLSTRVEADANGAITRTFGHFPFGEVWYETGAASKWKFTTYERDSESGLDYAMFRSYSSRLGRFMQADLLAGNLGNPESLNRYTYVLNDPENNGDPLGLDCVYLSDAGDTVESIDHDSNTGECEANGGYWANGWIGGPDWVSIDFENNGLWALSNINGNLALSYASSGGLWGSWTQEVFNFGGSGFWGINIPGVFFTPTSPTTATLRSSLSFAETLRRLKQAGFVQHSLDYLDFYHPGQLDLRDAATTCSVHIALDKDSGQVPGEATTGDAHVDTANPWSLGPGLDPNSALVVQALTHAALDMTKIYPGSEACK